MFKMILILVLLLFLGLTAMALLHHGYIGIFTSHLDNYAGMQVFTDLVIALGLFMVWLWHDAKNNNRNPWPWLIGTCTTGSIAPLIYLIIYKTDDQFTD